MRREWIAGHKRRQEQENEKQKGPPAASSRDAIASHKRTQDKHNKAEGPPHSIPQKCNNTTPKDARPSTTKQKRTPAELTRDALASHKQSPDQSPRKKRTLNTILQRTTYNTNTYLRNREQ